MPTEQEIAEIVKSFQAPGSNENCTIVDAQKFQAWVIALGLNMELVVLQGHDGPGPDPADELSIGDIQNMGVTNQPLYIFGRPFPVPGDGHMYNIALERAEIAKLDSATAFERIWGEHNQGHTIADSQAAILGVPSIQVLSMRELTRLQRAYGL